MIWLQLRTRKHLKQIESEEGNFFQWNSWNDSTSARNWCRFLWCFPYFWRWTWMWILAIKVPVASWVFPKIGVPQNGWFIMENPIKWMIWGYPYFWKHPVVLMCHQFFEIVTCPVNKQLVEAVYIHCYGGHGRTGIIACALLCFFLGMSPDEAVLIFNHLHSYRLESLGLNKRNHFFWWFCWAARCQKGYKRVGLGKDSASVIEMPFPATL